ncbi:MAG: hypothetical protein ACC628_07370 [Pirellulaceae bacterium]
MLIATHLWVAAIPDGKGAQAAEPVVAPQPIIVHVTASSRPKEFQDQILVTTGGLPDTFQDASVIWRPAAQQSPLTSIVPGSQEQIAWDASAGRSFLEYEFARPHLRDAGDPQPLVVRIRDPRDLTAGVYEGVLAAQMATSLVPDDVIEYQWPVVVIVQGRSVSEVAFSHGAAGGGRLTVGTRASVSITVDSVGVLELGQGTLEIGSPNGAGDENKYARWLRTLPIPRGEPMDCLTDLVPERGFSVPADWKHHVVYTRAKRITDKDEDRTRLAVTDTLRSRWNKEILDRGQTDLVVNRHHFEVVLPDCFSASPMRATVRWEPIEPDATPPEKTTETRVGAGILVSSHACFIGENVSILVLSEGQMATPQVDVVNRASQQRIETVPLEQVATANAEGLVTYRGVYQIKPKSPFSLQVQATGANRNMNAPALDVYFARVTDVGSPRRRLPVFAGEDAAPFQWARGTEGGRGGDAYRDHALRYECRNELDAPKVTWQHAAGLINGGQYQLLEAEENSPVFQVTTGSNLASGQSGTYEAPSDDEHWEFEAGPKTAYLDMHVRGTIQHVSEEARKTLVSGVPRAYFIRLRLEGKTATGARVYRVINETVYVEVTTFWLFCRPFIVGGISLLVVLALACGTIYFFKRSVGPRRPPPQDPNAPSPPPAEEEHEGLVPDSDYLDAALQAARRRSDDTAAQLANEQQEAAAEKASFMPESSGNESSGSEASGSEAEEERFAIDDGRDEDFSGPSLLPSE